LGLLYLFKSLIFIILINILPLKNLYSFQGQCHFEEVYENGEVQQGFFWYQEQNFRYEYKNKNLFTIIKNNQKTYLINNHNKVYNIYEDPYNVIKALSELIEREPSENFIYETENLKIIVEERQNSDFIKRIGVVSPNGSFSIYLNNCISQELPDKIFLHVPFTEMKNVF